MRPKIQVSVCVKRLFSIIFLVIYRTGFWRDDGSPPQVNAVLLGWLVEHQSLYQTCEKERWSLHGGPRRRTWTESRRQILRLINDE